MAETILGTANETLRKLFQTDKGPFTLQGYPGFPYDEWVTLQKKYQGYQDWYDGKPLTETITDAATGDEVDKYPIKINPIPGTCETHASFLLGNTLESIRDEGVPIAFSFQADTPEERAKIINQLILDAFISTGGGALFASNAVFSQYLGGCVFGVAWRPQDPIYKVQTIAPEPTEFIGYPDGLNYWMLRESWFVRKISARDAAGTYGYPVLDINDKAREYYYIEHYTKTEYRVSINEMTLVIDGVPLEGINPYGIVPYQYIPHIRTRGFWGNSMITPTVEGVIKEMNLRLTDIGDAVSDDSHNEIFIKGVRNGVSAINLPSGRKANNLGSSPGLSANDTDPEATSLKMSSASAPMLDFTDKLENIYRREAKHPAVADGEDEGSQRSSLTLTTRMLPLVQHVKLERINWTLGMVNLVKIILKVYQAHGEGGVTEEDLKCRPIIKWAPMLPRDREELVNEVAIRMTNNLLSQRHGLEMFQDVDDIEKEIELIKQDKEEQQARDMAKAEQTAKIAAANNPNAQLRGNSQAQTNNTSKETQ